MTDHAYSRGIYWFTRSVVTVLLRLYNRFAVYGIEHIPREGGCMLACNHVSYLDPPVVACAVPSRIVHFMARDTLFRKGWFGWLLHKIAVIPISRDRGDVGALKKGIQMLRSGECLAMFPEGTRSTTGELQQSKGGIGFLIAKARVPVVPVYVDGTYRCYPKSAKFIKPCKIRVFFGAPIQPAAFEGLGTDKEAYEKIGRLVMDQIRALKPSS